MFTVSQVVAQSRREVWSSYWQCDGPARNWLPCHILLVTVQRASTSSLSAHKSNSEPSAVAAAAVDVLYRHKLIGLCGLCALCSGGGRAPGTTPPSGASRISNACHWPIDWTGWTYRIVSRYPVNDEIKFASVQLVSPWRPSGPTDRQQMEDVCMCLWSQLVLVDNHRLLSTSCSQARCV